MNEENDSSQLIKRIEELEAIVTGKDIVESAGWWGRFSAYQFNQRKAVEAERDQLAAENKRLDADNAKAWNQRDQILKDRNALLTQLNAGPLSSDEWQIRAIRSEAERDQLAASLEEIKTQWREHLDDCVPLSNYREMTRLWEESGAKLDTARKALEAVDALVTCSSVTMEKAYFRFITTGQGEVIEIVRQALAQISNPTAALDERDRAVAKETARKIAAELKAENYPRNHEWGMVDHEDLTGLRYFSEAKFYKELAAWIEREFGLEG